MFALEVRKQNKKGGCRKQKEKRKHHSISIIVKF
jgi:hypothetical protein